MADLPKWQECWSPANLMSFRVYFEEYATDEEQDELVKLPFLQHKPISDPPAFVMLRYHGEPFEMRWSVCKKDDCPRCISGRGGWQFRWVDKRWSSESVLDTTKNPLEHEVMNTKQWPVGILKPGPGSYYQPGPVSFIQQS